MLWERQNKHRGHIRKFARKTTLYFFAAVITVSTFVQVRTVDAQPGMGYGGAASEARQRAEFYDSSCATPTGNDSSSSAELGKVYVLGDSITLGAASLYESQMRSAGASDVKVSASGGGNLDNAGSTGTKSSGLDSIAADSDYIKDADTFIMAHGTNNMSHTRDANVVIKEAMAAIKATGTSAKVHWVDVAITDRGPSNYQPVIGTVNKAIHGNTSEGYSVISWAKEVDSNYNPESDTGFLTHNNEYVQGDGIHLTATGNEALVQLVITSAQGSGGSSGSSGGGSSSGGGVCCDESSGGKSAFGSGVDGGGCGDSGYGNGEVSEANRQQIWAFFIENGLSEEATAGIMGNIHKETGGTFMPDADNKIGQYGGKVGVGCVGIVQWCFGRIDGLADFAAERGKTWDCLGVQLEYIWYEMTENDAASRTTAGGHHLEIQLPEAMNGEEFGRLREYYPNGTPTAGGAARMFHDYFERANTANGEHLDRDEFAEEILEEFTGTSGSKGASGNPACATKDSGFGDGIVGAAMEMGSWGDEYNACYDYGGGHGDEADLERRIDDHFSTLGSTGVDCSGFTRAVLLKGVGEDFNASTQGYCDSDKFEKIPIGDAKPGDFSIGCGAHIEVIVKVNGPSDFDTMGSHTTGCGPGKGPSPGNYTGTESFVLRWKG